MSKPNFRNVMGWTILVIWVVSSVTDILISSYDPPATVGALIMMVAGVVFGSKKANGNHGTTNKGEGNE